MSRVVIVWKRESRLPSVSSVARLDCRFKAKGMVLDVAVRNPCALLVVGACFCEGGVSKNVVLHFLRGVKKTNLAICCATTLHN